MTRILILGGGFGGVHAALHLSKKIGGRKDVAITLIDKNNSQTFQPALYEVASLYGVDHEHPYHTKLRGTVCIPFSEIFKNKKIEFVQAEVNHIDLQARHIVTNNVATIEFDYLIIAMGSVTSTFGIPGVEEYAHKFKTIEDALMVNDKVEQLYVEAQQQKRGLPISILIGGAGFNGVELAAELSNCTIHVAHRHDITRQNCTSITLVEAGSMILPMISESERNLILKRLKKLGINILINAAIEEIGSDFVKFKDGKMLKADMAIWSGGIKALDMLKGIAGLESDERGRILVNEFLQAKNHSTVFAVGDNTIFVDPKTEKPIPQMAYLAMEQGRVAAENIYRLIRGSGKLKKYLPSYNSWIAPVGGKYAVAHLWKLNFYGFWGYIARELTDLRYFINTLPFFKAVSLFFREIKIFSKND